MNWRGKSASSCNIGLRPSVISGRAGSTWRGRSISDQILELGAQAGKDITQLWQDSAHKMIDAQAALIRRWTGGTTRTRKQE